MSRDGAKEDAKGREEVAVVGFVGSAVRNVFAGRGGSVPHGGTYALVLLIVSLAAGAEPLKGTAELTMQGDIADVMIRGIDRFFDKQIEKAAAGRAAFWDFSSPEARAQSVAENRRRLGEILGVRDARPAKVEMELVGTVDRPALVAKSGAFEAYAVRWRAFGDVHGEGLLLKPVGREPIADVIAIPDADQTPEMIVGLAPGVAAESQYARRLAESGCRVVVPVLMDRRPAVRAAPGRKDGPELSNREYVYRQAFDLGRHVIGFEVQKVLAAVDWATAENPKRPVGVIGWGEGGMLALYAGALDARMKSTCVSGYFGQHEQVWREPIERNVWGLSERFGDAELALMVHDNDPIIEAAAGPHVRVAGKRAAPGELVDPVGSEEEFARFTRLMTERNLTLGEEIIRGGNGPISGKTRFLFLSRLLGTPDPINQNDAGGPAPTLLVKDFDPAARQARQLHELERHCQSLVDSSKAVRQAFMSKLDTSSPAKYAKSAEAYREHLYRETLGRFDLPLLPMNARTRKVYDTEKYVGYEVVLDVFEDVFAYGILLLPKDLKEGERRPVVVCQHGLEGRPKETVERDSPYYKNFAAKLAERGFITFSPQNIYIFGDRFRVFHRKGNPIGKTIWSVMIPQHQQILNFLKGLPNVDAKRIGFYGLSYGGKTAMRIPAVLTDYALSICSGDFNEWVEKNVSNRLPMSYVFTNEYEIFEWDLGSTFNYAEMAALIAPRPFMVERGHFDGVGIDEMVAYEFAKVRFLYAARLKVAERCQIEWFDGPHTINGKGTFDFLHKHLDWEKR